MYKIPGAETVLNPISNRPVKIGSQKWKLLVRDGVLKDPEKQPSELPEPIQPSEPVVEEPTRSQVDKTKVAQLITDLGSKNIKKLAKTTSDADLNSLLKKLLLEQLASSGVKVVKSKKKKKKAKKPSYRRGKYRVKPPQRDSDSEGSETQSDSDSSDSSDSSD